MGSQLYCVEPLRFESICVKVASAFLFQLVLRDPLSERINAELKLGILFCPFLFEEN